MSDACWCAAQTRAGERCVRDGVFRRDGFWLCVQHARVRAARGTVKIAPAALAGRANLISHGAGTRSRTELIIT